MMKKNKPSFILKIIIFTIVLFLFKNIGLFVINQLEINRLMKELSYEKQVNLDLIDEIKNIKTDSFVIRYAVNNLNLNPADKDIVDLKITEDELNEIKLRIELGIFGKKFEDIETPIIEDSSDNVDELNSDNKYDLDSDNVPEKTDNNANSSVN